jgi:excisionase family DNA binding protein
MSREIVALTNKIFHGIKPSMNLAVHTPPKTERILISAKRNMKLLTTQEAAERLNVTVRRVQAMIRDGRLPAEKMGRDWFIKEEDLALVANRKVGRPKKAQTAVSARPGEPQEAAAEKPRTKAPKRARERAKKGAQK